MQGCQGSSIAKGLCKKHYNQQYWAEVGSLPPAERLKRFPKRKFLAKSRADQTASSAAYYKKNKVAILARQKRNGKLRHVRHVYGLTAEQYQSMLDKQRGLCAVCRNPPRNKYGLCVDHCHRTNKIRGLLCAGCNTALAVLERDKRWTQSAMKYLTRHK